MAIIEHDRVWETATVTGTGNITLAGTPAATGARTFASVYANGDQCPYSIIDGTTGASETGIGTLAISGGVATLARTVVIESTNSNAAVAFAGNSCSVLVAKSVGVQTNAGAADAGKVPILNGNGVIDGSLAPIRQPLQAGQNYFTPFTSLYSYAPQASKLYFVWMPIPNAITIKSIHAASYGAPSSAISLRMGIYAPDPITLAPKSLLVDGGSVSIASNTTPIVTLPNGGLNVEGPGVWLAIGTPAALNGWAWVAFHENSSWLFPSAQGQSVGNINNPLTYSGYSPSSWTFGALPATPSPVLDTSASNFPLVGIST